MQISRNSEIEQFTISGIAGMTSKDNLPMIMFTRSTSYAIRRTKRMICPEMRGHVKYISTLRKSSPKHIRANTYAKGLCPGGIHGNCECIEAGEWLVVRPANRPPLIEAADVAAGETGDTAADDAADKVVADPGTTDPAADPLASTGCTPTPLGFDR